MKITHVNLAIASGIALLLIIGMVYIANTQVVPSEDMQEKENRVPARSNFNS